MIWIQILEYRTGEMLYKFGFPSTVLTFQDGSFFQDRNATNDFYPRLCVCSGWFYINI